MSAEISPLLVRTPAAARPLWLRLRRSSPFTLTVLMCCLGAAVGQPVYLDAGDLVQRHHLRRRYGVAAAPPAADSR